MICYTVKNLKLNLVNMGPKIIFLLFLFTANLPLAVGAEWSVRNTTVPQQQSQSIAAEIINGIEFLYNWDFDRAGRVQVLAVPPGWERSACLDRGRVLIYRRGGKQREKKGGCLSSNAIKLSEGSK